MFLDITNCRLEQMMRLTQITICNVVHHLNQRGNRTYRYLLNIKWDEPLLHSRAING